MNILLLGKNGQLGSELNRLLSRNHNMIALGREEIDLSDSTSITECLSLIPSVSLLINTAAFTAVDLAEQNERQATQINAFAPEILATEARRRGIPIIHFSTDYVFDGMDRKIPYRENDQPNPLSVYGKTKLGGEIAVRECCDRHLILRTSGIYGTASGFVAAMLRQAKIGQSPYVVVDQTVAPNRVHALANAIEEIVDRIESKGFHHWGTYHLSGGGETTWFDFASEIFDHYRRDFDRNAPRPKAIDSEHYHAAARRPAYSVLDGTKLCESFGISLPDWRLQFQMHWKQQIKS